MNQAARLERLLYGKRRGMTLPANSWHSIRRSYRDLMVFCRFHEKYISNFLMFSYNFILKKFFKNHTVWPI